MTIFILGYKVKFYTNENYTNYLSLRKLDLASRRRNHKNLLCTFHVFLSNLYNYLGKNTSCFVTTKKPRFPWVYHFTLLSFVHTLQRVISNILGTLRSDEFNSNENVKKATTTLHVEHNFFVHFFAVTSRLQRENS